jgi:hypothetical protein
MPSALIPSRLGYSAVPLAGQPTHQRSVHPGPLVLGAAPLKSPTPTPDRDRTVSRRSEPSSRTALTGEQPDPWEVLPPQDATSRHRGAKPCRRYERLGKISLSYSQALLCQCTQRVISIHPESTFVRLRYSLGGDRPSQTAHQALSVCLIRR